MKRQENKMIRKIYRSSSIQNIEQKILMLGDTKLDALTFLNMRLITSIIVFLVVLYASDLGYIYAPAITLAYHYLYYYVFIQKPLKSRIKRLDREALYFFL